MKYTDEQKENIYRDYLKYIQMKTGQDKDLSGTSQGLRGTSQGLRGTSQSLSGQSSNSLKFTGR